MTDAEARAILNSYGVPVNVAKHIEAINVAIRALGGKATMAEIFSPMTDICHSPNHTRRIQNEIHTYSRG